MIAIEQEDRDSGLCETTHLPDEEQSGLVIAPVSVIEITSDDDECDLFFNRLADEVIKGDARESTAPRVVMRNSTPTSRMRS
jgi:hypothetical protein